MARKKNIDGIKIVNRRRVIPKMEAGGWQKLTTFWQKLWQNGRSVFYAFFAKKNVKTDHILSKLDLSRIKNKFVSNYLYVVVVTVLIGMVSLLTYNIWGVKTRVAEAAQTGADNMKMGVEELKKENFSKAAEDFALANTEFAKIKRELNKAGQDNNFLNSSLPTEEYNNLTDMIDGLIAMSRGAKLLSLGLAEVTDYSGKDFSGLFVGILTNKEGSENILPVLDKAGDYFSKSTVELENGISLFSKIDEQRVPQEYKKWYDLVKKDSPRYMSLLTGVNNLLSNMDQLLGREVPVNYLLLFQNYNELRPTGGFIGSYGLMQFQGGKMTKLSFDDIYNPDGQMMEKITPPYPIAMMTKYWQMRDSNWDPDFPVSADNAVKMFEKEGGYTVDGVVAFTPEVVSRFLALTGPIEMKDYGTTFDEQNFALEVQKKVELDYDRQENKPKKILADLLPILMDRLANLPADKKQQFWQTMLDLLSEKHVLVFSYHPEIESLLKDVGWAGEVKQTGKNQDYLSLIHANIGGRKSDTFIKEAVKHTVSVDADGNIIVDLEITRKNIEDWTWPNYSNYDYLRVYVPEGSELLAVDGFVNPEGIVIGAGDVINYDQTKGEVGLGNTKIYSEDGKTVFGNWMVTDPWSVSTAKYRYKLPFKLDKNYQLYLQKQSGRREIDYMFKFIPGEKYHFDGANLEMVNNNGEYNWRDNLKKDLVIDIKVNH